MLISLFFFITLFNINMFHNYIISVFMLFSIISFGQSVDEVKKNRNLYIWGEGVGSTLKSADDNAITNLVSLISTNVESNFQKSTLQNTVNDNINLTQVVTNVVKTYSNATLTNTERIVIQNEPNAKVFRYIKRTEISKIFESRKNKIIELAKNADAALKNLQIADALRYFYWSQTLLRSHPDASNIKMTTEQGTEVLLITWIPMQINQIFANISVKIDQVETKESYSNYLLDIRYKTQPVRNFDYTYWGGQDWSNINSAKDGLGVVELPKSQTGGSIRLKCEYVFEGEAAIDMELRDVMQKLPEVPYKNCYITIGPKGADADRPAVAESMKTPSTNSLASLNPSTSALNDPSKLGSGLDQKPANSVGSVQAITQVADKESIMKKVIAAISSKNFASVQPIFTTEGYSIFQALLQFGNARIIKLPELKYYQFGESVICRSIPMSFNFKSNNRTFVEDVVFYFDKNNQIENLTFGLAKKAVDDIAANDRWSEEVRMHLINFMENYKTAFALKRLDYIEKIFSDDALIITGRVTKVATSPEFRYLNNTIVKYNQQSKTQYLKNLKYSFGSNEYVNLRFADNVVKQSGKSNSVYGIQIKQDYFTPNYGDTGYLFLLIDFTDTKAPQIHVRTWQPNKNADGSIYGLSDF